MKPGQSFSVVRVVLLMCLVWLACPLPYSYSHSKLASSYSSSITTMALAPQPQSQMQIGTSDVVYGTSYGDVIFASTQMSNYDTSMKSLINGSINWIDWRSSYVFVAGDYTAKVIGSYNFLQWLTIFKAEKIQYAVYGLRSNMNIIALAFQNRIELYQQSYNFRNLTTTEPCKAMTFDSTGNYFYYITYSTRYVYNLPSRSPFNSNYASQALSITASPKQSYTDITATISQSGMLQVWDDYSILYNYSGFSYYRLAKFDQTGNYLLIYSNSSSSLEVKSAQYGNSIGYWNSQQNVSLYGLTMLDGENGKFVYLDGWNTIYVYKKDGGASMPVWVIVIIVVVFVGAIAIGVGVAQWNKRRRMRMQNGEYQNMSSNQGFNNSQGFNNQPYAPPPYNAHSYPNQPYPNQPYSPPYNQGYNGASPIVNPNPNQNTNTNTSKGWNQPQTYNINSNPNANVNPNIPKNNANTNPYFQSGQ